MGNVLATSKPITGSGLPPSPGDLPNIDKSSNQSTDISSPKPSAYTAFLENLENPGPFEELHKKCKDVMPMNFEGARFIVNKGLSNHFQVSHTLNLSTAQPGGYRFGATYVGTKQLSPSEAFPVILGDIDPSGNLNANIIHQITPNLKMKFVSQIQQEKVTALQVTSDYKGSNYTASLTLGNPNILNGSGVIVAHFLQSVTSKLSLGGELAYQYGPAVPGNAIAVMAAAARYQSGTSIVSGTLGLAGVHLCYYQKASEQLQIGAEIETNFRMQEAVASVGYQVDLPKADLVFRGMLDTNWTVSAVLEKKLQPLPFSFALSGVLNHKKDQFKLGVGIIIG
jgi:mitochondrial import receptor subunit TOM40